MNGTEHYREAERLLAGAQDVHDVAPIDGLTRDECASLAQIHATMALAAAAAMLTTVRFVGDSDEVTEWARAIQPQGLAGTLRAHDDRPEYWPPKPGQIWQDRHGDRWVCTNPPTAYLVCLARPADDTAEEIWRVFGPMTFVYYAPPNEEEPPF